MALPTFEVAIGPVNGANKVFSVSSDYQSGSTRVWRNGMMERKDLVDGWDELGGMQVRLNEAPRAGDQVQIYYIPIT